MSGLFQMNRHPSSFIIIRIALSDAGAEVVLLLTYTPVGFNLVRKIIWFFGVPESTGHFYIRFVFVFNSSMLVNIEISGLILSLIEFAICCITKSA